MKNDTAVILYNKISKEATIDELDVLDQLKLVSKALFKLGFEVKKIPFSIKVNETLRLINEIKPKFVFNLAETIENRGEFSSLAPSILSFLKIPYTGSSLTPMFATSNKLMAKKLLRASKIPTADWLSLDDINRLKPETTYILKPLWEEGSLGLDENSVFKGDDLGFIEKMKKLDKHYFFIEEFIDGREVNASILGGGKKPEVLPLAEIKFLDYVPGKPKVLGYRAKWEQDSFEYNHTIRTFDFGLEDEDLLKKIKKISIKCWEEFGLRGYARVDFRIDKNNNPYVLEINANPCISPDGGFVAAVKRKGMKYEEAIERIVKDSIN